MIKVDFGYCAVKIGAYWVGLNKNGFCKKKRRSVEKALNDANLL